MEHKIRVGITQGDMNGVGPEVIIKALSEPMLMELCIPVVFSSQKMFNAQRKAAGVEELNFQIIRDLNQLNPKRPNLFSFYEEDVVVEHGKPSPLAGRYALKSIDLACDALLNGQIDVLVTAPVDKHSIAAEFPGFTGHTSYLQNKLGAQQNLMLLMHDHLRVGLVTEHLPLSWGFLGARRGGP